MIIEALVASGQSAAASSLARAYEATYPTSVHLSRVRALVANSAIP
jgi:hypothetical protein